MTIILILKSKTTHFLFPLIFLTLLSGELLAQDKPPLSLDQEVPTSSQILSRAKDASGGDAWDEIRTLHIKWKAREGGLLGTVDETDDLVKARYVDISQFGIRSGAFGFNGKIVWSQDSSGQAQAQESSEAREGTVNEVYRRSLAYWYPERWSAKIEYAGRVREGDDSFYVLKIMPNGGRLFELWFNDSTSLLERIVEKTATSSFKVFFSDYRKVDSVKVPFQVRVRFGDGGNENSYLAEAIEFNRSVSAARFDLPPAPPPDFSLSGNPSSITLPFEFVNNHIYIDGWLNGKGTYKFLVDTGWGTSAVTPEVASTLALPVVGEQQTSGAGEGTVSVRFTKVAEMQFGGVRLLNQSLIVSSAFDAKTRDGISNFGGLLGYELFKRFVVKVDFERKRITFTLPVHFEYQGDGAVVPFKVNNTIPQVRGEVDGVSGEFIIDIGFPGSLILYDNFVEKNDLVRKFAPKFEAITGWGIGGPVRAYVTRAGVFKLADAEVRDSILTLSILKKGSMASTHLAGAVGSGLLKQFNVTLDYGRQQLILEKNGNYGKPDVFDRSGMYLQKTPGEFEVIEVITGSPAEKAGIKAGDKIVSINGKKAFQLTLHEARRLFLLPLGTSINLILKKGESFRPATIVLRDIV